MNSYVSNAVLCRPRIMSFSSPRRLIMVELHPHSAPLSMSAGTDVLISSSRFECAPMGVASRNASAP